MPETIPLESEKNETTQEAINAGFVEILKSWTLEKRVPSNQGANGLVFKVEIQELPETVRRQTDISQGDMAVKTLKIYGVRKAKREYDMLSLARNILETENEKEPTQELAWVPRPVFHAEVEIDEQQKKYLNSQGTKLESKISAVSMDYIEGTDLATLLYKNFLVLKGYPDDNLESLGFAALQSLVNKELGMHVSENENTHEKSMVKVRKFLKKKGFILNPSILRKLKRTVDIWHREKLYHRDLHERNIMITPKDDVFIVDFGLANVGITEEDEEKKWEILDDYGIIRRLQPLTTSIEEGMEDEQKKAEVEFNKNREELPKNSSWQRDFEKCNKMTEKDVETGLEKYLALVSSQDNKVNDFLIMLIIVWQEKTEKRANISTFIDKQITNGGHRPFLTKRFSTLKKYLNRAVV